MVSASFGRSLEQCGRKQLLRGDQSQSSLASVIVGLLEGTVRDCGSYTVWFSVPCKQARSAEKSDFDKSTVFYATVSVIERSSRDQICYHISEVGRA